MGFFILFAGICSTYAGMRWIFWVMLRRQMEHLEGLRHKIRIMNRPQDIYTYRCLVEEVGRIPLVVTWGGWKKYPQVAEDLLQATFQDAMDHVGDIHALKSSRQRKRLGAGNFRRMWQVYRHQQKRQWVMPTAYVSVTLGCILSFAGYINTNAEHVRQLAEKVDMIKIYVTDLESTKFNKTADAKHIDALKAKIMQTLDDIYKIQIPFSTFGYNNSYLFQDYIILTRTFVLTAASGKPPVFSLVDHDFIEFSHNITYNIPREFLRYLKFYLGLKKIEIHRPKPIFKLLIQLKKNPQTSKYFQLMF